MSKSNEALKKGYTMSIKLNPKAIEHAEKLIKAHEFEYNHVPWSESHPTQTQTVRYLNTHDLEEYGEWFLGVDTDNAKVESKERYVYPVGDFSEIQRSALKLAAERAQKHNHQEVAQAAQRLLDLIEKNHRQ
jgi:hypothetical protein